jgi:hypothetical protein
MSQQNIRVAPDVSGSFIDTWRLPSVNERQAFVIGDPNTDAAVTVVKNVDAISTDYGVVVRQYRDVRTVKHFVAAASTNSTNLKATPGKVYAVHIYSLAAYPIYLKLYNKASAPAPNTDSALLIAVVGCQAGITRDYFFDVAGANFSTGIGYAVVKGVSDSDNTAVLVNDAVIQVEWL